MLKSDGILPQHSSTNMLRHCVVFLLTACDLEQRPEPRDHELFTADRGLTFVGTRQGAVAHRSEWLDTVCSIFHKLGQRM